MNVLYISYWSIADPLTTATVIPNLKIIRQYSDQLYLATIERGKRKSAALPDGIIHLPFYSFTRFPRFAEKVTDIGLFSIKLLRTVKRRNIDLIVCRGAMAAIFAVFLNRFARLPFLVESFEPHADYMLEGNTWKRSSIEYKFQRWIERKSVTHASVLMPVSYSYAHHLTNAGVPIDRIIVMPCCVDTDKFKFDPTDRMTMRANLGIAENMTVGIYVGKFGDLYLNEEAFRIFKQCYIFFRGRFFLIILSQQSAIDITVRLRAEEFPAHQSFVASVPHEEVPAYLSASDFSFSLARSSPSRRFLSPIKNGEYWANGLPILLSKSVEDDERVIRERSAGAVFDLTTESIESSLVKMQELVRSGREELAKKISLVASEARGFDIIKRGYRGIFEERLWRRVSTSDK